MSILVRTPLSLDEVVGFTSRLSKKFFEDVYGFPESKVKVKYSRWNKGDFTRTHIPDKYLNTTWLPSKNDVLEEASLLRALFNDPSKFGISVSDINAMVRNRNFGSYIKFSPNESYQDIDMLTTDFFDVTGLFKKKQGYGMFPSPQVAVNEFIIRSSDDNTGSIGFGYGSAYVDHEEVFSAYVSYRDEQFKELTRRVPFTSGKFP